MFSLVSNTVRNGLTKRVSVLRTQTRLMGGGGKYLTISETHTQLGVVFGTICWLWVFHRARHDLPVVLGWEHPWEHGGHDDHGHAEPEAKLAMIEGWDKFSNKAMQQKEDDDDDDEEENEEDDDDDDDDDE